MYKLVQTFKLIIIIKKKLHTQPYPQTYDKCDGDKTYNIVVLLYQRPECIVRSHKYEDTCNGLRISCTEMAIFNFYCVSDCLVLLKYISGLK